MAKVVQKARKVSVKRAGRKEKDGRFCIVCGNTDEKQLAYYYLGEDGILHRADFCRYIVSCANMVGNILASGQ